MSCEDVDWIHLALDKVQCYRGSCEHSNELSGSIEDSEYLDQLSDRQLIGTVLLFSHLDVTTYLYCLYFSGGS
jgi:hypothetical protein